MAINTEKRLLEKIRIALANDIITPYELSVLLHYRSENQLYMLMNAIINYIVMMKLFQLLKAMKKNYY